MVSPISSYLHDVRTRHALLLHLRDGSRVRLGRVTEEWVDSAEGRSPRARLVEVIRSSERVRAAGFEPASMAWQATVLTRLYYARTLGPSPAGREEGSYKRAGPENQAPRRSRVIWG